MEQHSESKEIKEEQLADLVNTLSEYLRKQSKPGMVEIELSSSELQERLSISRKKYEEKHDFQVGHVVKWKEYLKNRRFPHYNQFGIVVEVLKSPIFDAEKNSGSPRFREPLNIRIGIIDSYGEFEIFYYDKNRFEPID